jgi:hypothetical protein
MRIGNIKEFYEAALAKGLGHVIHRKIRRSNQNVSTGVALELEGPTSLKVLRRNGTPPVCRIVKLP